MRFSRDSEILMHELMKHFSLFYRKIPDNKEFLFNGILKKMYKSISKAEETANEIINSGVFYKTVREIFNKITLTNERYFPTIILQHINTNVTGEVIYKFTIKNVTINIHFYILDNNDFNSIDKIDELLKK